MMNRFIIIILLTIGCAGCATSEKLYYAAPSELPGVTRHMNRPGFWIGRQPSPDKVILNPRQIDEFNLRLKDELKLIKDINGAEFKGRDRVQFGLISDFANERTSPTNKGVYEKPGDIDFDELQNSGLDIGTPVAVLNKSADDKWCYLDNPSSSGWVERESIAFCSEEELESFTKAPKRAVVIAAKADLYSDPALKSYYNHVRMGTALPYIGDSDPQTCQVLIPVREASGRASFKKFYIKKESVNDGYLPYTARNTIIQAFKFLNQPYGWGDMHGRTDCSSFIQQVFASVGVRLPRNSADQAKAGVRLAGLNKAVGGVTLLHLKGHIMLFLGAVDGAPYAIHAAWGYREHAGCRDRVRVINRVAVTDLTLGKGSSKGSLFERLIGIILID